MSVVEFIFGRRGPPRARAGKPAGAQAAVAVALAPEPAPEVAPAVQSASAIATPQPVVAAPEQPEPVAVASLESEPDASAPEMTADVAQEATAPIAEDSAVIEEPPASDAPQAEDKPT